MQLVLSTFTGIGMLDDGFKKNGFCVVSAGDIITNQPIQDFNGILGKFDGIIGGSPCQGFSIVNRSRNQNTESIELFLQFARIVIECQPKWFLLENVPQVPDIIVDGYHVQRFNLNPFDIGFSQNRNRTFQFGSKEGLLLELPPVRKYNGQKQNCALACEGRKAERRNFDDFCKLQGFSGPPLLESFHKAAKYKAVGNGVHLGVSNVIARAIKNATESQSRTIFNTKTCPCGCGRALQGKQKSANNTCRKRLSVRKLSELTSLNSHQV
ncbi:hypothetical protein GCM10011514_16930 [Emticicia aquatilis]|uniref:DNA (cytosine-5-)-methyltransferase n=1 Tax=Emticicia aquatilis TaxID=1537369 RepID=A0A916YP93_9BACT|nr:DNA cytosine methyltransferase [Emticicia aquatilis]GGD53423.1 hypothetical protein GCM10011514_16930 [Emticicia aquatilis]